MQHVTRCIDHRIPHFPFKMSDEVYVEMNQSVDPVSELLTTNGGGSAPCTIRLQLHETTATETTTNSIHEKGHWELDAVNTTCAITLDSFLEMLVQRARDPDNNSAPMKGLVIGQVFTRDPHNPRKSMVSYYHAIPLLRILFKRDTQHVRHRYAENSPLVAKNPLTNSPISGEVRKKCFF